MTSALRSPALRHVLILVSGTLLAQFIPLLASPALTRLFTAAQMGQLATYLAIVSIWSVIATGRYELAIVPARSDGGALVLRKLALVAALVTSVIGFAGWLVFDNATSSAGLFGNLGVLGYVLPVSVLLVAGERCYSNWLARKLRYRWISASRVLQASSTAVSQVAAGAAGLGGLGLVCGQLLGQVAGMVSTMAASRMPGRKTTPDERSRSLFAAARRHASYPLLVVPGSLANEAATQLPLLILAGHYGNEAVGYLALAQRLMTAPVSLATTAVGDVFRVQAAIQFRERGNCVAPFRRYLAVVAIGGLMVVVPVALFGEAMFAFVFGGSWAEAGRIASMLSVMYYLQLVAQPFGQTALLAGMQRLDFAWNLTRLAATAGVLLVAIAGDWSFHNSLKAFAVVSACCFALYLWLQFVAARGRRGLRHD